jgi:hypothetical protein
MVRPLLELDSTVLNITQIKTVAVKGDETTFKAGHSPSTSRSLALLLGLDVLQVPYNAKLDLRPVPDNPADSLALGVFYGGKLVGYLLRYGPLSLGGSACSPPFSPIRDQVRTAMEAGIDIVVKSVSGA